MCSLSHTYSQVCWSAAFSMRFWFVCRSGCNSNRVLWSACRVKRLQAAVGLWCVCAAAGLVDCQYWDYWYRVVEGVLMLIANPLIHFWHSRINEHLLVSMVLCPPHAVCWSQPSRWHRPAQVWFCWMSCVKAHVISLLLWCGSLVCISGTRCEGFSPNPF